MKLDHEGNLVSGQIIIEKAGKIPYLDQDGNLVQLTTLGLGLSRSIRETLDGGYLIIGRYDQNVPDSSLHMIKTDKNGTYV